MATSTRILPDNDRMCFAHEDPDPNGRQKQLQYQRGKYPWAQYYRGVPPVLPEIPETEIFDLSEDHFKFIESLAHKALADIGLQEIASLFDFCKDKANPYEYWEKAFQTRGPIGALERPACMKDWKNDRSFGWACANGLNPNRIVVIKEIPSHMEDLWKAEPSAFNLKDELAAGRILMMDYELMSGVAMEAAKNPCAPCVLLHHTGKEVLPFAIKLLRSTPGFPIIQPNPKADFDGHWLMAKIFVATCDLIDQQLVHHFFKGHIVMEAACVAMMRTMSNRHPLFSVLRAHFFYTIRLGVVSRIKIVSPGGLFDKIMIANAPAIWDTLLQFGENFNLERDLDPVTAFKNQGLLEEPKLPGFYFRDDALRMFDIIKRYIEPLVDDLYPGGDAQVEHDDELNNWIHTLMKPLTNLIVPKLEDKTPPPADFNTFFGCGFKGIPGVAEPGDRMKRVADLKRFLTILVWNATGNHAATNNGQYAYHGFVPMRPGKVSMKVSRLMDPAPITEKEIVESLPGRLDSFFQIMTMSVLSTPTDDPMGKYVRFPEYYKNRPKVLDLVKTFQGSLSQLSRDIKKRNEEGVENGTMWLPYTFLDPEWTSQSVSN